MALTPRFGLTHFGLGVDGSLFDDGGKYTGRDRRVLDRILAALETHDHSGGTAVEAPDFEPDLELSLEGGALPSGVELFYRVSFIDRYGLETAAGPEVSVLTPGAVSPPDPPRLEADPGGTLAVGLWWYALTVHSGGNETQMSPAQVINLSDWNTVKVSAPDGLPEGTEEVSVWRQGPLEAGFTRLVTLSVADPLAAMIDFFVDDGSIASDPCACDPENLPPQENLTNATNSVKITIPSSSVEPATGVQRWRVYRSTVSGQYGDAALVAEVTETTEEHGGDLVAEFTDVGAEPAPGAPVSVSQTLAPSKLLPLSVVGALPDATTVPDGFPVIYQGRLRYAEGGVWRHLITGRTHITTTANLPSAAGLPDGLTTIFEGSFYYTLNGSWEELAGGGGGGGGGTPVGSLDLVELEEEPEVNEAGKGVLYYFEGELRFRDAAGITIISQQPEVEE